MEKCENRERWINQKEEMNLLSLPLELLVCILSCLTTRDKVKIRNVSQRLRVASETPSLWSDFVWPFYDYREEHFLMNVLTVHRSHIKRLILRPSHMTPSIFFDMLSCCERLTHLSLPPNISVDCEELMNIAVHMKHLEILEVKLVTEIKPFLQIVGLKELTVYVPGEYHERCNAWVQEWMENSYIPYGLNVVTEMFDYDDEVQFFKSLLRWNHTPLSGYTSFFRLYYDVSVVPLNLFPSLPQFQLTFGQTVTLPFVKTSSHGLLGLDRDILVLTNCTCNGRTVYKAECVSHTAYLAFNRASSALNKNVVNSLTCVIEFNFTYSGLVVNSDHLEQLAIACPNLQRLSLQGNTNCLKSLKGLRAIKSHCHNLRGLNLSCIQVSNIENYFELWEILSDMKLTHLVMELCVFQLLIDKNSRDVYNGLLIRLYQKCSSLRALQFETVEDNVKFCAACKNIEVNWSLLAYFPVLKYCNVSGSDCNICIQDVLGGCKELVAFSCTTLMKRLVISSAYCASLQQLWINSTTTDISDVFMTTVSAHGGLEHVFFSINSVTVDGVSSLIANSPRLLTFKVSGYLRRGKDVLVSDWKKIMLEKYSSRKL